MDFDILTGIEQVIPQKNFEEQIKLKKKLKIKFGADPTAPDLHLGHAVALNKLRQFQDLGHEITFIIGDFTAMIGDPTGKSKTRPILTKEEVEYNAKTYLKQVGRILDLQKTKIVYNSSWLSKLSLEDTLKIAGKITLARIIERDDFSKRFKNNISIGIHELFYPIMQAYDSVIIKSDLELGGTDQTFNLLMGRFLQEQYGQQPQVIMTIPLLEGLDGVKKMSKSLGNYIGLWEDPYRAYGKLMSISDELMFRYYKLLLNYDDSEIDKLKSKIKIDNVNPMNLKKQMSFEIIKKYWSEIDAQKSQFNFESLFQKRDYSQAQEVILKQEDKSLWIVDLLKKINAIKTSSEAKRLILSRAVRINNIVINDFKEHIKIKDKDVVKVGKKKIYKIKLST